MPTSPSGGAGMLKWVVGIAAAVVLLGAGVVWWGYSRYRQITAGGDTATVAIAATPARVFASLANADSLPTWMDTSATITTVRHGLLAVDDTIQFEITDDRRNRAMAFVWIVRDVRPGQVLALELQSDTLGRGVALRRDSLVASAGGDSTTIVSIVSSPMMDSLRRSLGDTAGRTRNVVAGLGSRLLLAAFRTQAAADLARLKARVEGAAPPPANRQ